MNTSKTLPLLRDNVTLSAALRRDDDVIHKLGLYPKRIDFYFHLYKHRSDIETLVSFHLGLSVTETCYISEVTNWVAGSFNVCIPVHVTYHTGKNRGQATRVLVRIPLPYKVGEEGNPGNVDEKLRCEAATYLWMQQHCPEIRTAHLLAFGFSDGPCFTALENAPFYTRLTFHLRRMASLLSGRPIPCNYISRPSPVALRIGYLIVEYIEESQGKMLSSSWEEGRHDQKRRNNLFRDLSRIMLSLSRVPLPHIGSLTINNGGIINLTNRPLTLELEQLENENIPTNIGRNTTYSTVDAYLLDLLDCHDSRLQNQRNALHDEEDGQNQIAAIMILRAMLSRFTTRDNRYGPFILTLTDTHQSNIFVDSDWHITHLIDLEWACSLPIEMLQPPHWLTGRGVDELEKGEHLLEFAELYEEFMGIFEEEELLCAHATAQRQPFHLSQTMRRGWRVGSFWYFKAISSPSGSLSLFFEHIYPIAVDVGEYRRVLTPFWGQDSNKFIAAKLADKRQYDRDLRTAFEESLDDKS